MWCVTVGANQGVREGNTIFGVHHRRHFLQVNLVHNAVAGWDYIHIFKRGFGPVDKVEAVVITTVFNGAVLFKGVFFKACVFNCQ